jgi:hypothetical protein
LIILTVGDGGHTFPGFQKRLAGLIPGTSHKGESGSKIKDHGTGQGHDILFVAVGGTRHDDRAGFKKSKALFKGKAFIGTPRLTDVTRTLRAIQPWVPGLAGR